MWKIRLIFFSFKVLKLVLFHALTEIYQFNSLISFFLIFINNLRFPIQIFLFYN
jgi:hypothetical protein